MTIQINWHQGRGQRQTKQKQTTMRKQTHI